MINVIDNFIAKEYQDYIEALVCNAELPLYLNLNTIINSSNLKQDENTIEEVQFTHAFMRDGEVTSNHWGMFSPIVYGMMAKTGVTADLKLVRAKLNVNTKSENSDDKHYTPHLDSSEMGITAIYYLNDSDGDTLFFSDSGEIIKRISPAKGTLVYFNSNIYHAGQPPKINAFRSVINFNWVEK
jgi:hypothetical protein